MIDNFDEFILNLRLSFNKGQISGSYAIENETNIDPEFSPHLWPVWGTAEVPPGIEPQIIFGKRVKFGTGTIKIWNRGAGLVEKTYDVATSTELQLVNNDKAIILKNAGLDQNKTYNITIDSGAILDYANNAYAGFSSNSHWHFTMDFTLSHTVSPVDGAANVGLNSELEITFSEAGFIQPGTIRLYLDDGTLVNTFNVEDNSQVEFSLLRRFKLLNPNLQTGKNYYILADPGVFTDGEGNDFPGFTDPTEWNFSTVADTDAPAVIQYEPAHQASNISLVYVPALTYDEPGQINVGNITIKKYSDDSLVKTIDVTTAELTGSRLVLPAFASNELEPGEVYYIEAPAGIFQDQAGNNSPAISGKEAWKFTTENPCASTVFPATGELANSFGKSDDGGGNFVITWTGI